MTRELSEFRSHFPALEDKCHLLSHSLGCMPARAVEDIGEYLHLWQRDSALAWRQWLPECDRAAGRIERLLSAPEGSVAMNTTCSAVNALVASCFEFTEERNKVVLTALEFPTVSYVWHAERRRGAVIEVVSSDDGIGVDTEKILDAIDETTVVVPISHAFFGSSFIQDAKAICRKANSVGAHVVLDCYQTLGCLPIDIVDIGASFACGGSLKYLCGGPGAAFLYVRRDLIDAFEPRVTGWFGHETPFSFDMPEQNYADGIWRYMGGTPSVLPFFQARAGAEIVAEVGVRHIREHSQRLTRMAVEICLEEGFELSCPEDDRLRAGTVIFDFPGSAEVARELGHRRFFCDHRPGRGIRIGPHFYNSQDEVAGFFAELTAIREGRHPVTTAGDSGDPTSE